MSLMSILNPRPIVRTGDDTLLHHFVESNATAHPDTPAIQFLHSLDPRSSSSSSSTSSSQVLTYAALNANANQLAHYIQGLSTRDADDAIIPVYLDRSVQFYVALLAILKAGAAYVPVAPDAPFDRLHFICTDTNANIVITDTANLAKCAALEEKGFTLICLDHPVTVRRIHSQPSDNPSLAFALTQDHLAYVLYTSGSTGKPKGVLVPHGAVVESILAHSLLVPHEKGNGKYLQFAAPTFDVSVLEMFLAFCFAHTLCSATKELLLLDLVPVINALAITHVSLTPTVAALVPRSAAPSIKVMTVMGEVVSKKVIDEWASGPDGSRLHNLYGPTECAINCTMARYFAPDTSPSNIGHPLDTCTLYIMAPAPDTSLVPLGNRMYRTGDLARFLPNGTVEYLGRIADDEQVKLRGLRIELGEISHVIASASPIIVDVITLVVGSEDTGKHIVAFVVVDDPSSAILLSDEREGLQIYSMTDLEHCFPRTVSGKTDRSVLKLLAATNLAIPTVEPDQDLIFGGNDSLARIRSIVADIAQVDIQMVGLSTPLIQLGVDSLRIILLVARLRREGLVSSTNNSLGVSKLMLNPTVEHIYHLTLEQQSPPLEDNHLVRQFRDNCAALKSHLFGDDNDMEDCYPCTPLQTALLTSSLRDPTGKQYLDWFVVSIPEDIPTTAVQNAWTAVRMANTALRTSFRILPNGEFMQVVHKEAPVVNIVNGSVDRVLNDEKNKLALVLGEIPMQSVVVEDKSGK
ncbi:hypothetical protein DFJ77DRAFT_506368 [Powellomyces hirtus]|nr:hypothetical protein DFJ77DRAFT_506368 [Powellomyces hirtus]